MKKINKTEQSSNLGNFAMYSNENKEIKDQNKIINKSKIVDECCIRIKSSERIL